ncbi:hypothetical protein [Streptomyces sp. GS7]|uniref:hypothetical protein n=1 Tax=Streptomyces sp. GS7 TaxID=2692234 RepID=UPI00131996D0|nr:hypothetical protein [Streptomyces sp. GS7]QHC22290.1 hypothetical protein GR130_13500 [Streptomyces sp. GS7]
MKFRIKAGAEVDFLTKDELNQVLTDQLGPWRGGVRYKRIPYSGTLPVTVDAPESGFVWSVKLLSVVFDARSPLRVYTQTTDPSSLVGVERGDDVDHVMRWQDNQLTLFGTQPLIVAGSGVAERASGLMYVAEVPVGREWQL